MHILNSKLTRPVPPEWIVDRPHLFSQLDQWRTTPVIFVHAPAGYGKSILASRWLDVRGLDEQTAWLSLDPGDDDPRQFLRYVAAALDAVAPGASDAVQPLLDDPEVQPVRALENLLGRLQSNPHTSDDKPLLLVLDDLQQVDTPALGPLMALFMDRRPARLHFMLLGRMATYGPLVRLFAAQQVLELGAVELRFQPEEIAAYLTQRGHSPLSPEVLARLDTYTEGWIVALQLIVATIGNRGDINELLTAAVSRRGWLAEYLTTQILADLSPVRRTFLLQSAILDRFNTSLLNAVTGTPAAYELLSSLVEAGLPLMQLDSRLEWFRYHHLFQELLQARMRQELSSPEIAALHRRAAAWLARHDQVTAAVQHALEADDLSLAAAILESAVRPEILRGGILQVQKWLALLPNDALDRHPRLLLDMCLLRLLRSQATLVGLVARTEAALASVQLGDKERRLTQAELTVYKIYGQFYSGNFAGAKELLRNEDQRLADADLLTQALILYLQSYLAWYRGEGQVALAKGNQAIKAFRGAGLAQAEKVVQRLHAQISAHRGHVREALAMLQEIADTSQSSRSFVISELIETLASAAFLRYWIDDIEGAQRDQQSALALAQRLADPVRVRELDSLSALFNMARAASQSIENEHCRPLDTMGTVPQLNRLYLHQLVRQGQVERAWHLAADLGVRLDGKVVIENLAYLISLLEVTLARGIDLDAARSRIDEAITLAERLKSRLYAAELLALSAWCYLQMGQREKAERALAQALDLAVETGYIRFILDIPALAPLLAVMDHPAAAGMWVATVPDTQRRQAAQLTDQERLVLGHLARPGRYQDIAGSLGISVNTVRTHIRNIYRKLGVNKRDEAVARARALRLIDGNGTEPS